MKKGPIQSSIWFKLVPGLLVPEPLVPGPLSKVALSNPHDPGMYMIKWHLNLFMTKKHVSSCGGLGPWGFRSSKSHKSNRSVIFPILIFGFHLCVSRNCIVREVTFLKCKRWNLKATPSDIKSPKHERDGTLFALKRVSRTIFFLKKIVFYKYTL